ncbi:MAG: polysaccharide deacetylase family protein [Deltaproteobacteria bacterium]|nr:polysaccharide deacetylase family protein [Deltaproteobacteria bacterium]
MIPGIFITIDVECSMGGAWADPSLKPIPPRLGMMGEYNGRFLGIPLICDILERYGLKATFFVEPFNDELGYPGETEPVCRYLVDRGQDVQLHIHPNHYHYGLHRAGKPHPKTDQMADLSIDAQRALIEEGAARLERWTGRRPVAFRAGNMAASEETLMALSQAGIHIDSSYTFPYLGAQCRFQDREKYNGTKWYGDVLEVALSGFQQRPIPGLLKPAQPVDLMGTSFPECREAVRRICAAGADAVVILHSFSLFKVRDVQYHSGRLNRVVTRRFEKFCRWLAVNSGKYPCRTFLALSGSTPNRGYIDRYMAPCTLRKPLVAILRKIIQFVNNCYYT